MVYFTVSVLILTALLFFPMSKLVWVLSVRRLERRLKRKLSEEEIDGQLRRARLIAVILALLFSFLFSANIIGIPANG
jgi:dolichol kinase